MLDLSIRDDDAGIGDVERAVRSDRNVIEETSPPPELDGCERLAGPLIEAADRVDVGRGLDRTEYAALAFCLARIMRLKRPTD